jgi:hypothetical protein
MANLSKSTESVWRLSLLTTLNLLRALALENWGEIPFQQMVISLGAIDPDMTKVTTLQSALHWLHNL